MKTEFGAGGTKYRAASGSISTDPNRVEHQFEHRFEHRFEHLFAVLQMTKLSKTLLSGFKYRARDNRILLGAMLILCLGMSAEIGMFSSAHRLNSLEHFSMTSQPMMGAPTESADYPPPQAIRDLASVALARPLFSPSRMAQMAVPKVKPDLPRLAGTMIDSREQIGILYDQTGKFVVVKVGERVSGLTVVSISANTMQLNGPAGIEDLNIRYDSDPPPNITTPMTMAEDDFRGLNSWPSQLNIWNQ